MLTVMRLRITATLAVALTLLCVSAATLGSTGRALAAGACPTQPATLDAEEQAFLTAINEYRVRNGVGPLALSPTLGRAAEWHSADMAANNYFSHSDKAGRNASGRARECGYPADIGENIAAGSEADSGAEAFSMFVKSTAHRDNMLHPAYKYIGIARANNPGSTYNWYWTTDLGTEPDSAPLAGSAGTNTAPKVNPLWVNDLAYGSKGGGVHWDPATNLVWTAERGWHSFKRAGGTGPATLWVDDLAYGSGGGGFYLDPLAGLVWTAERGWHAFKRP
jgi:uncharacterized protein YkwD